MVRQSSRSRAGIATPPWSPAQIPGAGWRQPLELRLQYRPLLSPGRACASGIFRSALVWRTLPKRLHVLVAANVHRFRERATYSFMFALEMPSCPAQGVENSDGANMIAHHPRGYPIQSSPCWGMCRRSKTCWRAGGPSPRGDASARGAVDCGG